MKLFMFLAPRDGRWIEIGGLRGGGTAFAFWNGAFWDDGAGYEVDGWWWRACDQEIPV